MDEKFSLLLTGQYKDIGDIPSARIIWQPRMTKPKAQENSMLFKGYPGTDMVKVIWIIPQRELWDQYMKGMMLESQIVVESIDKFQHDRSSLEAPEADDASDEEINNIYKNISNDSRRKSK